MSLRPKILLSIMLSLGFLLLVLHYSLRAIVIKEFDQVEARHSALLAEGVKEIIDEEMKALSDLQSEWSDREELKDALEHPLFSNLSPFTMASLSEEDLDHLILFIEETVAFQAGESQDSVADLISYLQTKTELIKKLSYEKVTGFINFEDAIFLVSGGPVYDKTSSSEIGSLLFTRHFDGAYITRLEQYSPFPLNLYSKTALADLNLSPQTYFATLPIDENNIQGILAFQNLENDLAFYLGVDLPRDVMLEARLSLRYFSWAFALVSLIIMIVSLVILEKLILSRLGRLSQEIKELGVSKNIAKRLSLSGKDELAALARTLNTALDQLQESKEREKQLKTEVQALKIQIDEVKKSQQVKDIVETDYFKELQQKAKVLRSRNMD